MKLPWLLGCLTNHHQPIRRRVKTDAAGFHGTCRHCGEQIRRHGHGDWRREVETEIA